MKWTLLFLAIPALYGGWVVDQTGNSGPMRYTIGASALKMSYSDDYQKIDQDLIADFAAGTVIRVDHTKKTVAKMNLDAYLKQEQAERPSNGYAPKEPGKYAGMNCLKLSYSYNGGGVGNWGGGTGCYTKEITVDAAYQKAYERWMQIMQGHRTYPGFALWYEAAHDGPPRVALETKSLKRMTIPAKEFEAPAGYKTVAFPKE